jgi:hypothetical protein
MKWEDVRSRFPDEWVVMEAIKAHSENGSRYIDEVIVIDRFEDSFDAMRRYYDLHHLHPQKEYCFFHTSREELVARERYAGIRGPR